MIITISRDFGSGGHTVGRGVAKELGIEFYDRDIIKAAVEESGMKPEDVELAEEEISRLIAIIEPTLVALLAIIIGAVLLAVLLPMAGILSSL